MKPYYEEDGIKIYHGDCRVILPTLNPGSIVTDPPYPDYHTEERQRTDSHPGRHHAYGFTPDLVPLLAKFDCRQFVFWSAREPFPLDHTAVHIWDKKVGAASQYERIFERNGQILHRMFRHLLINSTVSASFGRDVFTDHPSQKPIRLMRELLALCPADPIVDPFMGSGSTLRAAKDLGREAIGIEIEERYCEMAVNRLAQGVLNFADQVGEPG